MKTRFVLVALALLLVASGAAHALVNLEWRPTQQSVTVGDTLTVGLYAVPDNAQQHMISAMDVIVNWDPTYLSFEILGDPQPLWMSDGFFIDSDGINNDRTDGDVLYTGMGYLGEPIAIAPQGALCVEFIFTALAPVDMTSISIMPALGTWGRTSVYDGSIPNLDIKGSIGAASVSVVPVPEPSSLAVVVLGMLPLLRFRRR